MYVIKANTKDWMDEEKMKEFMLRLRLSLLVLVSIQPILLKNQVKQTNLELLVVPGGSTKELQPLDIGVNQDVQVICCHSPTECIRQGVKALDPRTQDCKK